jgi:hypothetical protein
MPLQNCQLWQWHQHEYLQEKYYVYIYILYIYNIYIYILSGSLALINGACHYLKPDVWHVDTMKYIETLCKIPHFLPPTWHKSSRWNQQSSSCIQPLHGSPSSSTAITVRFDLFVLSLASIIRLKWERQWERTDWCCCYWLRERGECLKRFMAAE